MIHLGDMVQCKNLQNEFNKIQDRKGITFEQYLLFMNNQQLQILQDQIIALEKKVSQLSLGDEG